MGNNTKLKKLNKHRHINHDNHVVEVRLVIEVVHPEILNTKIIIFFVQLNFLNKKIITFSSVAPFSISRFILFFKAAQT